MSSASVPQAIERNRRRTPWAGGRTTGSSAHRRRALVGWGFALPFVVVFGVFSLLPLVSSLAMSFTDLTIKDLRNPFAVDFVGLDQFAAVFGDELFLKALRNTLVFVVFTVPLTVALGLLLAVALNSGIQRFRAVFRVGFYTPVVTSIVAIAVVWRFILQPDGLLNTMLGWVGIAGPDWLNDTTTALPALVLMSAWRNMGNAMVLLLAGLQGIPADTYEAAAVDGANAWQRFTRITIPLLRPTLLLVVVILSIGCLQFFEEPFVMTSGGPLNSTLSVGYFVYNQFGYGNYSYGTAAAYVLFVVIAAVSTLQFRLLRSKES